MAYVAITLLNDGYELAFIAGVLGNITAEGSAGLLEGYDITTKKIPADVDYKNNYAMKNIQNLGIKKVQALQEKCAATNTGFGLGACQWTFGRTQTLLDCYKEVCGDNDKPTLEQCIIAESLVVARELEGSEKYAYTYWVKNRNDINDAYNAGRYVCKYYERPKVDSSAERGNKAADIYKIMLGK